MGTGGEGKTWTLGKPEVEQNEVKPGAATSSAAGGPTGRGIGGEEQELKEMSKKGGAGKEKGKGRGKRKAGEGEASEAVVGPGG